jgi:hypothetical protein
MPKNPNKTRSAKKPRLPDLMIGGTDPKAAGSHNLDLESSTGRILKGATWKKQRVVVIVPAGAMIPAPVYLSHRNLMFPPNQPQAWFLAQGLEVGEAYSRTLEMILEHPELSKWEFLLTIEHDNTPPSDGLLKIIARMEEHPELACIGGLYWTKGEGGVPQIWGDPKDPVVNYRPQPPDPKGGLVESCGTGMGFNLWRLSMFKDKKLRRPWFKTLASATEGIGTQDLYFWSDARKHGYRCAIDCSVKVGHYDAQTETYW